MKAYSMDLRERVIAYCDSGSKKITEVARLFNVSRPWIYTLLHRREKEGSIAAYKRSGGRKAAFHGETLEELDRYVAENSDTTLKEIKEHFSDRVQCSIQAIANALDRLGWRYKKNHYERVSKTEMM